MRDQELHKFFIRASDRLETLVLGVFRKLVNLTIADPGEKILCDRGLSYVPTDAINHTPLREENGLTYTFQFRVPSVSRILLNSSRLRSRLQRAIFVGSVQSGEQCKLLSQHQFMLVLRLGGSSSRKSIDLWIPASAGSRDMSPLCQ